MTEIGPEISGNPGGAIKNALRLIRAAADAGPDAVKFQCFEPEQLAARRATRADVLALTAGVPLIELYRTIHTQKNWFQRLIWQAKQCDLRWFWSAFDPDVVAFIETLNCPGDKLSPFE